MKFKKIKNSFKHPQFQTKQIAGKIIPALATTTAVVSGLVCIELYKTIEADGLRSNAPIERYKNCNISTFSELIKSSILAFLNLAIPFITSSEPRRAPRKRVLFYGELTNDLNIFQYREDREFTLWDRLEVNGPKTMGQLIDWIEVNTQIIFQWIVYTNFRRKPASPCQ